MIHSFETRQCPLCDKVLQLKVAGKVQVYKCPEEIAFTQEGNDTEARSHYEVELDGQMDVQHMYAGNYAIDNFANGNKSRIYFWSQNDQGYYRWKFVTEVPRINPGPAEKLEGRIKTLMAFL